MTFMQTMPSRAARTIAEIGETDASQRSGSEGATYLHIRSAGHRHDIFEPFSPEQQELVDWLRGKQADMALCDRAWDVFVGLA